MVTRLFKCGLCIFIAAVLTFSAAAFLPFLSEYMPNVLKNAKMKNAVADISDYDIDGGDSVYLAGEWNFYWDELLVSDKMSKFRVINGLSTPDKVSIPSSWTTYTVDGQTLKNGGIATYTATLKNVYASEPIVISLTNMPGKYRVYIDGKLVCSNCRHSIFSDSATSGTNVTTYPIELNYSRDGEYEIEIEVSCAYSSGITVIPVLSSSTTYNGNMLFAVALRYMVIGIVLFFIIIAAVYNAMMKKRINLFWLILLGLSFVVRLLITGEAYMVSHELFFNLNYEIVISIVYVLTYIIELAMFMYIFSALELKISQPLIVVIVSLYLVCAFVPYFIYDRIYMATSYMWLQSMVYVLALYVISKLSDAVTRKIDFSLLYLFAYCVVTAALSIDSFYLNGFISINASMIFPMACIVFVAVCIIVNIKKTVVAYSGAKRAAVLTKELADINMTLMLSQIQPHFLYNALNTIKYLTKKDPKAAENAIVRFSSYLRANMESLTQKEPIPFLKELDHVKNYTEIEKMRFGDRLQIMYDIKADDFTIPPLTVQPLVENSIKHGVNQRADGGSVTVSSSETDNAYIVTVSDNGVGYDVKEFEKNSNGHVGISNIKARLKEMLDAEVCVESVPEEGTVVTISIPKKKRNSER